jgi:hypothetical protein
MKIIVLLAILYTCGVHAYECDVACEAHFYEEMGQRTGRGATCYEATADADAQCKKYGGTIYGGGCTDSSTSAIATHYCHRSTSSTSWTVIHGTDELNISEKATKYCNDYCSHFGLPRNDQRCRVSSQACRPN